MIIWGGSGGGELNSGSFYDQASDSWSAMSTGNAPSARHYHGAVWTGSRMIIWGGVGATYPTIGGQWVKLSYYVKN